MLELLQLCIIIFNMQPIGIFDSGFGGLTVMKEIVQQLPQYDYIYLGDNARTPYGTRSFETVYQYTLNCIEKLFALGCPLVIVACNTASAKALRTIQQNDLPKKYPNKKVLGVIRPTAEIIGNFSTSKHIGILATKGTVVSNSYVLELEKFYPNIIVHQHACPMWVPIIENNEIDTDGAHYFIKKDVAQLMQQHPQIDTILLACTHYPLVAHIVAQYVPKHVQIISQGQIVAASLADYLQRHTALEAQLTQNKTCTFYTTDTVEAFEEKATQFYGQKIVATHL
jgi:glutamate racemase